MLREYETAESKKFLISMKIIIETNNTLITERNHLILVFYAFEVSPSCSTRSSFCPYPGLKYLPHLKMIIMQLYKLPHSS